LTRIEGKIDTNHNTVQGQLNAINDKLQIAQQSVGSVLVKNDTVAGSSNGTSGTITSTDKPALGGGYKKSRTHKRVSKLTPRRR
jgi:hypothetical protein